MALIDGKHWCRICAGVEVPMHGGTCGICLPDGKHIPDARKSEGKKDDAGKIRWRCLPWKGLLEVGKVVEHGAKKYGELNWQKVEPFEERYSDALLRHIAAWASGETHDAETGIHHLAHAAWNCLALLSGPKR